MSASYIPYHPEQQQLLPSALQDWLPQAHLAYFINDTVDSLNLSGFHERYACQPGLHTTPCAHPAQTRDQFESGHQKQAQPRGLGSIVYGNSFENWRAINLGAIALVSRATPPDPTPAPAAAIAARRRPR